MNTNLLAEESEDKLSPAVKDNKNGSVPEAFLAMAKVPIYYLVQKRHTMLRRIASNVGGWTELMNLIYEHAFVNYGMNGMGILESADKAIREIVATEESLADKRNRLNHRYALEDAKASGQKLVDGAFEIVSEVNIDDIQLASACFSCGSDFALALLSALSELTVEEKRYLSLSLEFGLSIRQIAKELGMKKSTASTRLNKAIDRLRALLLET